MQKMLYFMIFLFVTGCTDGDDIPNHIVSRVTFSTAGLGHLSPVTEKIGILYSFDTYYEKVDYSLDDLTSLIHFADPDGRIVPMHISNTDLDKEGGELYINFTYDNENIKDGWYTLSIDQDPKYNVSPYTMWGEPLHQCNITDIGKSVDADQFLRVSLVDRTNLYGITFALSEAGELKEISVGFSQNLAEDFYLNPDSFAGNLALVQVDGQFVEGNITFVGRLYMPPPYAGFAWVSDNDALRPHDAITVYINQSIVSSDGKEYEFLTGSGEEIDGVLYKRIVFPVSAYRNCDLRENNPVVYGDEISILNGGE